MAEDSQARGNRMADLVGPFYVADSTAPLLGCAPDDLPLLVEQGRLLVVHTGDGSDLYPTFQFGSRGAVRLELMPLFAALSDLPRWSVAVWLRTPNMELDGVAPERWLAEGRDAARTRQAANHFASRLAH